MTPMTSQAASQIQAAEARANDGRAEKGSFAATAQAAAARNERQSISRTRSRSTSGGGKSKAK